MANKKRRKKKGDNKGIVALAVVGFVCLGIVILAIVEGDFAGKLESIWENTFNNISSPGTDKSAEELANLAENKDKLIVYTVDTGNSDCHIIREPGGKSMIIDAADEDDFDNISGTLRALGIEKLDIAVATHPDADHIGSMDEVVQRFSPGVIYMPDASKDTAAYRNLIKAVKNSKSELVYLTEPFDFNLGEAEFVTLSPRDKDYEKVNDTSIVLRMNYGENSALFTGDIETLAIDDMLKEYGGNIDVDLLKVAHHGSARSTTYDLLEATTPEIAVITAGQDNDYGHPHKKALQRLNRKNINILRTDENGDIAIFMDKNKVKYSTAA